MYVSSLKIIYPFLKRLSMSDSCRWLHEQLERLPLIRFPFKLDQLPEKGIYFFYEDGEVWGHGGDKPRIVRIGTHKNGNLRSRIKEHYLLDKSWMNFNENKPKPSDRSIFRKNIGRALLNKDMDGYLQIWNINFIRSRNKELFGSKRNIEKEKRVEEMITRIIREKFSFRFIVLDSQKERKRLERSLIGTVAQCKLCKPSANWLGNYSPIQKIRESGLWLVHYLKANPINENDKEVILNAIRKTREWLNDFA